MVGFSILEEDKRYRGIQLVRRCRVRTPVLSRIATALRARGLPREKTFFSFLKVSLQSLWASEHLSFVREVPQH